MLLQRFNSEYFPAASSKIPSVKPLHAKSKKPSQLVGGKKILKFMAQKINPIALRLYTNLNFDSCWYNNSNYVNLLIRDLKVKNYINNILKKSKLCHARFHILSLHNKQKINVFFCNPASARSEMLVSLRVKDGNTNTKMSLKPGQLKSSLINKNFPAFSKIINLEKARYSSDLAGKFTSVPTAQTKSCTDAFLWKTSCKNLGKKIFSAMPLPAKSLDLHLHRRSSCKNFSGEPSFLTGNKHTNVYLQTKYFKGPGTEGFF